MKKYLPAILLGPIIVLAIVTRFYKLGAAPAGLYVDEAGQGYSAYSILKTGKDEFGKAFPIVFRSLTDFKTPVYIYLIVPLIPIFGLTAFTVRFPSFLFSILTIPVLYFLIKEIIPKKSLSSRIYNLALISCLLLAISPWHILFGRTNFECNVALFFFLAGVLAFYLGLKKPWVLIVSAVMFAIAIPAYHSQRIITPLMMLILFIRFRKTLIDKIHKPYLIVGAIIGLIISLPTLSIAVTPGFLARANGLNIFSHAHQMPDGYIASYTGFLAPIINGSWFLSTREFLQLYFSYLSPRYMFVLGDYGTRSSFPDLSTFFLWQFPFYIYGLWLLVKRKGLGELKFFTIVTLLISPIPAAVTRDPYTTIRALPLVIPQIIIIAIGTEDIFARIKGNLLRSASLLIFAFLVIYSIFKLYSSGIILNEYYRAKDWDYGWRQVAIVIENLHTNLPVVVDNARSDAYPQLAFFLKYDPEKFQIENFEVPLSQYYTNLYQNPVKHVGAITVRPIIWKQDLMVDQYLIGDELGISLQQIQIHKLTLVAQINYPDGTPAYRIVRTNPAFAEEEQRAYDIRNK
jgi:4-amino-4-deoxy-L-arabinose transferase-like glycosyltransferase